jgi:predicted TPR repeat methyltransferase
LREQLGDKDAAIAAFRKVRELDPQDLFGATLRLVRLGAETATGMPEAFVRGVFDQYAARFDADLVDTLAYRGPQLLRAAIDSAIAALGQPARFAAMLDLGCGTGLAGAAFRDCVDRLTGVDLSPNMIAMAEQKKIYNRLEAADLSRFLDDEIAAGGRYPLIVAADVLAYFRDLTQVCSAAARVLAPGGLLAFTVETHPGDDVVLGDKLRFAHGEAHVRHALAGLAILGMTMVSTRNEGGEPVPCLLAVAQSSNNG